MSTTGMVLMVGIVLTIGLVVWVVHQCGVRRKATEAELARLDDQLIQCDERLSRLARELEEAVLKKPD